MDVFFSRHQFGFRKGYSAQQCLLTMLEKWKSSVDNKIKIGALLTDLCKAFDRPAQELLAKLYAYEFSIPALRLVYCYLKNRKQSTKINSAYSSWEKILFGVPQGSILGAFLFNMFLCDLFYMISDTDVDDNTPYVSADTIDEVIKRLDTAAVKLFKWFADDQVKANQCKCHLISSKNENVSIYIGPFEIKNTSCEKLLGIKVDSRLNFNEHLDGIIRKASRKISGLSRTTPFMSISKRRILMNLFFKSQLTIVLWFGYFIVVQLTTRLTVYMKDSCVLYIVTLRRPLKIFCRKLGLSQHINMQLLATEMYKISKNVSVPLMRELFHQKVNDYDLLHVYSELYRSLFFLLLL